ncbi:MAG TPA: DUF4097 family beta strand repeat-containing protein [Candidatus Angelobacter sp.]|nr:DUF4097 family beta strand repeat-containing protein [Candidatus Angelobacter sp.]
MHLHNNRYVVVFAIIVVLMFGEDWLFAASPEGDRVVVPIADATRPVQVRAHLLNGSITVKGYDGKEVIVEAKVREGDGRGEGEGHGRGRGEGRGNEGMKRVPMSSTGLSIEAENNQVRVSTDSVNHTVDLTLTVPVHSSLSLHTVNDGNISVTGVEGELDVNDINGEVTLKNISGSAVAHALNGRVLVTFNRVDPQKPMAFSSMNGDIDVTFPADLKANLSMRSDRGDVYSDFDIQLQTLAPQATTVEDNRGKGGKYVVKVEKTVRGTINGGGPEIQFKNFNGSIYIRKAGK